MPSPRRLARIAVILATIWLLSTWLAIALIDFLNAGNLQSILIDAGHEDRMPLWFYLYSEGQWTERFQWILLGAALAIVISIRFRTNHSSFPATLAITTLISGLFLMLIEDALNLRHIVADIYLPIILSQDQITSISRTIWETGFYAFLAALMTLPVLYFWRKNLLSPSTKTWVICAYFLYGVAGFSSALRRIGDWQDRLGSRILARIEISELPGWANLHHKSWIADEHGDPYLVYTMGYLLTDHLIEESIELIAASLLLVALVRLREDLIQIPARSMNLHLSSPAGNR